MIVLVVAHGFPPFQHSGTFRTTGFVRHLPAFGIQPIVLCSKTPNPAVPAYQQNSEFEKYNDPCPVLRVDWNLTTSPILLRFPIINYLSLFQSMRGFIRKNKEIISKFVATNRPNVVYASYAPALAVFLARHIAREFNLPMILDFRDPWTFSYSTRYRSYIDYLLQKKTENYFLHKANRVIYNTKTSMEFHVAEFSLDRDRTYSTSNGYDRYTKIELSNLQDNVDRFRIVYTGQLVPENFQIRNNFIKSILGIDYRPIDYVSDTRSLKYLCLALKKLFTAKEQASRHIHVDVYGTGGSENCSVSEMGLADNFTFHGPVEAEVANSACLSADLLLLLQVSMFKAGHPFPMAVPGKLFNYLSANVPILAAIQESDATQIIRSLECGSVTDPTDVDKISSAIEKYYNQWLQNGMKTLGNKCVNEKAQLFDRRALTGQLASLIRDVSIECAR